MVLLTLLNITCFQYNRVIFGNTFFFVIMSFWHESFFLIFLLFSLATNIANYYQYNDNNNDYTTQYHKGFKVLLENVRVIQRSISIQIDFLKRNWILILLFFLRSFFFIITKIGIKQFKQYSYESLDIFFCQVDSCTKMTIEHFEVVKLSKKFYFGRF